jgi:hypothetical protein
VKAACLEADARACLDLMRKTLGGRARFWRPQVRPGVHFRAVWDGVQETRFRVHEFVLAKLKGLVDTLRWVTPTPGIFLSIEVSRRAATSNLPNRRPATNYTRIAQHPAFENSRLIAPLKRISFYRPFFEQHPSSQIYMLRSPPPYHSTTLHHAPDIGTNSWASLCAASPAPLSPPHSKDSSPALRSWCRCH